MNEIILLKSGEIMMKGLNRGKFENQLMKNAMEAISDLGKFSINKSQSAFFLKPEDESDLNEVVNRLNRVFGFAGIARSLIVEKDFDKIKASTIEYLKPQLDSAKTFKVLARRSDKTFPLDSPEISRKLGGYILEHYPNLIVDVHNPELEVVVEVREKGAYIHSNQLPGAGGMPVGTSGKAILLISGGIDSPVQDI